MTTPRRSHLIALALTLPALLSGCGSARYTDTSAAIPVEERQAAFPIVDADYAKLGYRRDWAGFPFVRENQSVQFLEAQADGVLVFETGSTLSFLEAANGSQRWASELANPLTRFVGIARDERGVMAFSQADAYLLDANTGDLTDRQPFARVVSTEPAIAGSLGVFGTGGNELLAHLFSIRGVRGVKAWGHYCDGAIEVAPVRVGSAVGAVSRNGEVIFADLASGALLGRSRIFTGVTGAVEANPASDGQLMFIASLDQSLYAFDTRAREIWRHRTAAPLRRAPVVHDGVVYCDLGSGNGGLSAFDAASGKLLWQSKNTAGVVIAVRAGRLIVWDGSTATTLDPKRGDVFDRVTLPNVAAIDTDAFVDGNLYVASREGVIAKFAPR